MRDSFSSRTVLEAVEIVKPRLVFNGHMHAGGYKTYEFIFGTEYIYIDSSQVNRHYVILYIKQYGIRNMERFRKGI